MRRIFIISVIIILINSINSFETLGCSVESLEITEEKLRKSSAALTPEDKIQQLDEVWAEFHGITKNLKADANLGKEIDLNVARRVLFGLLAVNADFYVIDPRYQKNSSYYYRFVKDIIVDLLLKNPLGKSFTGETKKSIFADVLEQLRVYNNHNNWVEWLYSHNNYWENRFEDGAMEH